MADKKISELVELTARTENDVIAIVDVTGTTTNKIKVSNFTREPVIDGGNVSGTIPVDLSLGRWYKFNLTNNASVVFSNIQEGSNYVFWVFANGNYSISSMTISGGGDVYAVGGSLPNPSNNSWNLYQAYAINGDLVLTEIGNFSAV